MSLPVGALINGKYRVVRLIGDGGMGSVYEATHEALGSRVALKSLHPELAHGGLTDRFLQEARAAARIQNPHVVRVADVEKTETGLPFMVLEYLEGRTLQTLYEQMYQEGRRLSYGEALDFAMQLFEGVEAAHQCGVVHRDLKPDNVMIIAGPRGAPLLKLVDFGIAKFDDPSGSKRNLTRPGVILGTPQYMAPEQVYTAGAVDVRADVFALGVILFEMLAGRRPVGGDDPQQIAVAYMTGGISRLHDLAPELSPALVNAVHRAMEPNPIHRFGTVREFREAIEPFALALRAAQNMAGVNVLGATAPAPPNNQRAGVAGTELLLSVARPALPGAQAASQLPSPLGGGAAKAATEMLPSHFPVLPLASAAPNLAPVPGTWGYDDEGKTTNYGAGGAGGAGSPNLPISEFTRRSPSEAQPYAGDPQVNIPIVNAQVAPQGPANSPWAPPPQGPEGPAAPYGQIYLGPPAAAASASPRKVVPVYLWIAVFAVLLLGLGITIGAAVYFDWFNLFDDPGANPSPPRPGPKKPVPPKPRPPATGARPSPGR